MLPCLVAGTNATDDAPHYFPCSGLLNSSSHGQLPRSVALVTHNCKQSGLQNVQQNTSLGSRRFIGLTSDSNIRSRTRIHSIFILLVPLSLFLFFSPLPSLSTLLLCLSSLFLTHIFIASISLSFLSSFTLSLLEETKTISNDQTQVDPTWAEVLVRGIGANWLVCTACFLAYMAREFFSKVAAVWWPTFGPFFLPAFS